MIEMELKYMMTDLEQKNMNISRFNVRKGILVLLGMLTLVTSVDALPFTYQYGDLCLGFRKTGSYVGLYEIVVDLGPAVNYVNLPAGTTTNVTQYTASQIDPDSYASWTNLQWSVTGCTPSATTFTGYPKSTVWVTSPRVGGVLDQPYRASLSQQNITVTYIDSILSGAATISSELASNQDNTATCVREPYAASGSYPGDDGLNYGAWIEDPTYSYLADLDTYGPLDSSGHEVNLENTTVAPFITAVISDIYEIRPSGTTDPHTGLTSGVGYNVGYFIFNPNGTMTFTRASTTVSAPVAGFSGTPTSGFAPLPVLFTDASTGTITNWLWNFGDGTSVTNTSNASVNHTYTSAASYNVSLTVTGPGGANTLTRMGYIVVSPAAASVPRFNALTLSGGKFIISGTNGTTSAQYRVLSSTNLISGTWTPVFTNTFLGNGTFSYTNSAASGTAFFRLVSP